MIAVSADTPIKYQEHLTTLKPNIAASSLNDLDLVTPYDASPSDTVTANDLTLYNAKPLAVSMLTFNI